MARPKKADTEKKPRKPRETKAKAAPDAKAADRTNEPKADPELRALAISHRDKYSKLKERLGKAQSDMRAFGKEVKQDGFTLRQIKLMVELSTPEGEQAWRMTIANDLIAAQYQGAAIGQQLALFLEPDRTPAVDIAYDQGVFDCVEGKTAKSPYAPSVPQTQSYLKGYADEQERRLKGGIKKLDPEQQADRAATLAAARGSTVPPAPDTTH
jgi:hypothetical protein